MVTILSLLVSASKPVVARSGKEIVEIVFSELEKKIIEDYYNQQTPKQKSTKQKKGKNKGLPPGLAKRETLPPGLAKQLKKNGTLPPGLEKRVLPDDLASKLPSRSKTFERVIVGTNVLLIQKGTNLIYDILKDILTRK